MRWLFLLLLTANVAIFYWGSQREKTHRQPVYAPDIGSLRLLEEIPAEELGRLRQLHAGPASEPGSLPVTADDGPDAPNGLKNGMDAASTPARESDLLVTAEDETGSSSQPAEPVASKTVPLPAGQLSDQSVDAASPSEAAAPEPEEPDLPSLTEVVRQPRLEASDVAARGKVEEVPEPGPAASVSTAQTASLDVEVQAEKLPAEAALPLAEPVVTAEAVTPTDSNTAEVREVPVSRPVAYCAALGPFSGIGQARSVAQRLEAEAIDSSLRRELDRKSLGYRVVLPPYKSQQAAIDAVLELRRKGVKDIRRFIDGDQKNGISLGVFSRRENAERRRREIAAKGFQPRVESRYVETVVYWVDYRSEGKTPEQLLAQLKVEMPDIEQQLQACPRIVRPRAIP